jgi:hypothetical protein
MGEAVDWADVDLLTAIALADGLRKTCLVDVIGTNWNHIKRELIIMWQIVVQIREETTVTV